MIVPPTVLHALRAAILAAPDGETRLRDAGYQAGRALYEALAAETRRTHGADPTGLPVATFGEVLGAYLAAAGWGSARIVTGMADGVVRVEAAPWVESDADAGSPYPICHFSTGLLAGVFGRAAGARLAVLETACRAAGAPTCAFAIGSREVMDAVWEELRLRQEIEIER